MICDRFESQQRQARHRLAPPLTILDDQTWSVRTEIVLP
jgi:hypothetical protein